MNSFSMFKKISALLLSVLMVLSLCSCSKGAVYQTQRLKIVSGDTTSITYNYTYTADNKPAIITANFVGALDEDYTDVFGYNDKGEIVSYSRKYVTSIEENYTAEKITDNKYIFKDKNGNEYLTIIFDETGFIVSRRYTDGYVTEYAYSYDKNGKPTAFKQLDITPSGSNRVLDFEISFTDKNSCRMTPVGENAIEDVYYEATFNIIE